MTVRAGRLTGIIAVLWTGVVCLVASPNSFAQDVPEVVIRRIVIEGEEKTREHIIKREMTISEGDRVPADGIDEMMTRNQQNIFNLQIFNEVKLNIRNWTRDSMDLYVSVVERWYILPTPVFELADRNFNVWWQDENHDFSRVHYGMVLTWDNFTGRADRLKLTATFGFSQIAEVFYKAPHFSRNGKIGAILLGHFSRSRQVPLRTVEDKHIFFEEDRFNRYTIEIGPRIFYRSSVQKSHYMELRYNYNSISDSIAELNPDFLLDGRTRQQYFQLSYAFEADFRNYRAYPTSGWYFKGEINKYGIGIFDDVNFVKLRMSLSRYNKLSDRHYTSHLLKWQLSSPTRQPFMLQEGLGFNQDFIRGYELYVLDGQSYVLLKNSYKFRLISFQISNIKPLKRTKFGKIPFNVFLKAYFDAGYVTDNYYQEGNDLRNEFNYGWGIGLDITTFYDRMLRLEYSFNKFLENGLYLHFEIPI